MARHLLALLGLFFAACAGNSALPESDRVAIQQDLQSHARYLKTSMRVTPFFQDDGKWLLADRALDELDLIDGTDGQPISPGAPLGILPAGTRLRVERVEFPTALVMAERVIYSPRYNPWVYLVPADAGGTESALSHGKPFILVLPPQLKTKEDVFAEIDRFLSREDLRPDLKQLTPQIQEAIVQKNLAPGMAPEQVQMAWGYPEHIHIDETQKSQVWTWPLGKQQATFRNNVLIRWTDHGTPGGSTD
jgi:hypothetical protein